MGDQEIGVSLTSSGSPIRLHRKAGLKNGVAIGDDLKIAKGSNNVALEGGMLMAHNEPNPPRLPSQKGTTDLLKI